MADARGNRLRRMLSGGQVADITQAPAEIEGCRPQALLGDRGFEVAAFIALNQATGAQAVIAPRTIACTLMTMIAKYLKAATW